jgi:ArsR family transcriptional regulator
MRTELPLLPEPRLNLPAPRVDQAVAAATLLSDPTRAAILRLLRDGPHCVCEMAAATGQRENNLSNHLARLREAGLVQASRHEANARFQYYERDESAISAACDALREILE